MKEQKFEGRLLQSTPKMYLGNISGCKLKDTKRLLHAEGELQQTRQWCPWDPLEIGSQPGGPWTAEAESNQVVILSDRNYEREKVRNFAHIPVICVY